MALLTPEQRALGRQNANTALGVTRRDFLKAAAVAPAIGAFYFGYTGIDKPVRAAIIGTGPTANTASGLRAGSARISPSTAVTNPFTPIDPSSVVTSTSWQNRASSSRRIT